MSEPELLGAWGIGREVELVGMLATNVVAVWRLWARTLRPHDEVAQRFAQDVLARWRIGDETIQSWQSGEGGDDEAR